ncbi:MAG TPA: 5-formyltetrahydrofolate cyclo-ligase [bacterium]|nr:5-formyltetrahydrofolate cyclo-ligase [bacterium]
MKKTIRRKLIRERNSLDAEKWARDSAAIQEKLLSSDFYSRAEAILAYAHFGREVKTDMIIADAFSRGKTVCIPYNFMETKTLLPSVIHSPDDIDRSARIPGPFDLRPFTAEKLDLLIIPGVAFDRLGNRIGMGSGFFDRFLKEIKKGIIKAGLAFDFQVLDGIIPFEDWDEKVDMIITEKRTLFAKEDLMAENNELVDNPGSPIHLTDANFDEALKKYQLIVVDFWASWCMPCKMIAPTLEKLAEKHKGSVVFGKMNVDENQSTPAKFNIMSIPTLIIFRDGKQAGQLVGAVPEKTIEEKIFGS